MKQCIDCKEEKELTEFARHPTRKLQPYCKVCQRARSKLWYQQNKKHQIANIRRNTKKQHSKFYEWKKTLTCALCPENETICLDFHHLKKKDFNISQMIRKFGVPTIINELNKCCVICSNCHRKVHAGLVQVPTQTINVTKEIFLPS